MIEIHNFKTIVSLNRYLITDQLYTIILGTSQLPCINLLVGVAVDNDDPG